MARRGEKRVARSAGPKGIYFRSWKLESGRVTHPFQSLGIGLILTNLAFSCLGAELRGTSESFVACPPGSKSAPEGHPVFGADENIELLALRLAPGPYADRTVYARLVTDVSAIRALDERMQTVRYRPPYDGRSLLVYLTPEALAQAKEGLYPDWNCLNGYLGARVIDRSRAGYMEIRFPGLSRLEVLTESYGRLVGVLHVEPNGTIGDSSNIYVSRRGADWAYVFDLAGGDRPSGCLTHGLHYFEVSADGRAREIATWKLSREDDPPDWVKSYFRQYH